MTVVPRMKFEGSDSAKQMNRIFAENLQDLLNKIDDDRGKYPSGFMHTSTMPHQGTHYYDDVWIRDGGRGLIELARYGFTKQAERVSNFFLNHINLKDHWGRVITQNEHGKEGKQGIRDGRKHVGFVRDILGMESLRQK